MVIVSGMTTSRVIFSRGPVMGAGAVALAAAADRGERAGALGIVERVDQRQLAAAAFLAALDRLRLGGTGDLGLAASRRSSSSASPSLSALRPPRGATSGLGLLLLAETPAGGVLGARAERLLGLAARLFLDLAALGLLALALEAGGLGVAAHRLFLGDAGAPRPRGPCASASALARASISSPESWRSTSPARGLGFGGSGAIVSRWVSVTGSGAGAAAGAGCGCLGLGLAGHDDAALLALDLHGVGPAMRKALAHGVALDAARLQPERLPLLRDVDRLVAGVTGLGHVFPCISADTLAAALSKGMCAANTHVPAEEVGEGPDAGQHIVARRPSEQSSMYHI